MREKIQLNDDFESVIMKLAEGNMGAINVIINGLNTRIFDILTLLKIDDMNLRGSQIWVAFKDYCGEDMNVFRSCIDNSDPNMILAVNIETARGVKYGYDRDKAVQFGASMLNPNDEKLFLTDDEADKLSKMEKPVFTPSQKS